MGKGGKGGGSPIRIVFGVYMGIAQKFMFLTFADSRPGPTCKYPFSHQTFSTSSRK
jgi:hypothetical protein